MNLKIVFPVLLITGILAGCQQPGAPSGPARKKMPEFSEGYSLEGPPPFEASARRREAGDFAFQTSGINLPVNGSLQGFLYVPLPDPANDSLVIRLLENYKALALPMLKVYAAQQQGVAIDLSSHRGLPVKRTDYVLEKAGEFSIPVVLLWDAPAAPRVTTVRNLVSEWPSVTLKNAGN